MPQWTGVRTSCRFPGFSRPKGHISTARRNPIPGSSTTPCPSSFCPVSRPYQHIASYQLHKKSTPHRLSWVKSVCNYPSPLTQIAMAFTNVFISTTRARQRLSIAQAESLELPRFLSPPALTSIALSRLADKQASKQNTPLLA